MFEFHIDFQGQSLAEQITQGVISASVVLGFILGFFLQDIRVSLYVAAGVVSTGLLVVPAWPYLKRHPVSWLPSREKAAQQDDPSASTSTPGTDSKDAKEKSS